MLVPPVLGLDALSLAPGAREPSQAESYEALLRSAGRLVGVPAVVLYQWDGGTLRLRARVLSAGTPPVVDAAAALEALCLEVVRAREPLPLENARADLRFRREMGGEGSDIAAYLGVPLFGDSGEAVGALAAVGPEPRGWSAEDVEVLGAVGEAITALLGSERLQGEADALAKALWQAEARHRKLLETVPVGIFALDREGRCTEANAAAAEIVGRRVRAVPGSFFEEFVAPEDVGAIRAELERRRSGSQERVSLEPRMLRPTGERRLVQVATEAVLADGGVVGLYVVARDTTEERVREQQLRRAERMASVAPLLSGVCHELNNPLTSIKSFAELLLLDERSPEDRESIEIVQREAHRAAKIVSDLRVVARQTQEAGTGRGLVDLNQVVRHALEVRETALRAQRVRVDLDLAEGLPAAWAVRTQLDLVALQLISNAAHALQEQPPGARDLTLRTYRGSMGVVLQVEDRGPGIAPEHLQAIFDPFWTTRRAGEGTGLGLSLAQSIVIDHGGNIRVDSTPGRGASFTVELPIAEQSPVALGHGGGEGESSRPLHLLVVDDEPPIRLSLQRYMERRGHKVEVAEDGAAALVRLEEGEEGPFDVILADLRMPGLNGEQLLGRLQARGDGLDQRVIFITGDQDSPDVADMLERAGAPVVQKPFELAEIAQIIEAHAGMAAL